ncbi:hypothetical protein MK632_12140 [Rhizobium changzhiense]|nr:hypothetical protein [Rhizobium changzhiense]MCH4546523.1 hypothetical protein [Rhizobium changzhiense]
MPTTSAHHLVAVTAGKVSGTLRVIYAEEHVKISRVAVLANGAAKALQPQ